MFTRWLLAYEFAIARSASEDHRYSSANFSNINSDYQYNIDTTNPLIPKLIPVGGYSKIYDPTTYQLSDGDVSNTYSPQLNLSAGFSAARNYNLKNHFSTFEFGFKFRNAHKFQDTIDRNWVADQSTNSPDLLMSNFLSNATHPDYYGNDYPYGPTTNFASIRSFINTSPLISTDENATDQSTIPNNYDLIEKVTAGYIMLLGAARLLAERREQIPGTVKFMRVSSVFHSVFLRLPIRPDSTLKCEKRYSWYSSARVR